MPCIALMFVQPEKTRKYIKHFNCFSLALIDLSIALWQVPFIVHCSHLLNPPVAKIKYMRIKPRTYNLRVHHYNISTIINKPTLASTVTSFFPAALTFLYQYQ